MASKKQKEADEIARQQAEEQRRAEQTRSEMEQALGREDQALGQGYYGGSTDPRVGEYFGRYDVDTQIFGTNVSKESLGARDPEAKQWMKTWKKEREQALKNHNKERKQYIKEHVKTLPKEERNAALLAWDQENSEAIAPYNMTTAHAYLLRSKDKVNTWKDQAETLARSGDFEGAKVLNSQIDKFIGGFSSRAQEAFNLYDDPTKRAQMNLMSPTGRTTGNLMYLGRQLQKTGSAEYQALYGNVTKDALQSLRERSVANTRNIVAEGRSLDRRITDQSLKTGAGRFENRDLSLRTLGRLSLAGNISAEANSLGSQQAALLSRASQWMQRFSSGLAGNAADIGEAFLSNSPGANAKYLQTLAQYGLTEGDILGSAAKMFA